MYSLSRALYLGIRKAVKLVYPKTQLEGVENLPDGPCVIVGNHAQMHGPIVAELYIPGTHYTWCAAEMMHLKEVPDYAYRDFWSGKPKSIRWMFRIASYLIAPLSVCVFRNANCIGVYRDMRALSTFRETLVKLENGARIVILPEENVPYNDILWHFKSGFVDLARMYSSRTGQPLPFVPMYISPELRCAVLGRPVFCDCTASAGPERERVCYELAEAITGLARELPEHTVIPYPNISKKLYPKNTAKRTSL